MLVPIQMIRDETTLKPDKSLPSSGLQLVEEEIELLLVWTNAPSAVQILRENDDYHYLCCSTLPLSLFHTAQITTFDDVIHLLLHVWYFQLVLPICE